MNNLYYYRKQKNLSQQAVAEYLGVSKQAYSNYENDKREAGYETLMQLSDLFEVSVDRLLGHNMVNQNNDDELKTMLFGSNKVSDELLNEIKRYAKYLAESRKDTGKL